MTGQELIDAIKASHSEECEIAVGCQGYLSSNSSDRELCVSKIGDTLYVTDICAYPEIKKI